MPSNAKNWGGFQHSKSYQLMMEGPTPISKPIDLSGTHAVTGPNQNLSDAVTQRYVEIVNGVVYDRERVIRPAQQLSVTMTLFFGNALETPIKERAKRANCVTTLYSKMLCPEPREDHAYIWEDCILNTPVRVNDPITIQDTALADWQSEFRITEEKIIKEVGAFKNLAAEGTPIPINAVTFLTEDCVLCTANPNAGAIAVGGIAGGEDETIAIWVTDDRFASKTDVGPASPAPTDVVGTSVYNDGNTVLIGFSDLPSTTYGEATDPAAGGTLKSSDGGLTYVLDTNIAAPIMGVGYFNGKYIAVGGVGAAAAYFASSEDGVTWTSHSTPSALSTHGFTAMSVDEANGRIYLATSNGKVYMVEEVGDGYLFTLMTLPGSPTGFYAIAVLDSERVAVGGKTASSYYYAETFDGGNNWVTPAVGGTTRILAVGGSRHHSMVGAGLVTRNRSILTDFEYSTVALQLGATITGNITSIAFARNGYLTHTLVSTDDGEILMVKDYSPFYS